ncbi:MAG: class I tRNA ligase family protein, partial [Campylobacterota bacterium]|nr:class I tRNA ligase family protein [Campylobacterota bacterium]
MSKTTYDPKSIETAYYKLWEERGYFEIDGNKAIIKEDQHFAIMLPPPNVTGSLHIGHALNHTLIDIITRFKRMDGYKTLWQPGTDHAGIATQNVVEKQLLAEGTTKEELGREKFLERVWKWKEHSGGTIVGQMRKIGVSPAWSRERFTMDEGLKSSVKEAFVHLYNQGIIVRGNYMVNWCTHDGALSDIEVEHEEKQGNFYHMRYFFADGSGHITVATTRPETYFGDTAVMVHPDDERYTHLIGKKLKLP